MRRATAPIRWTCIAMLPSSLVAGAQCLAVQLLHWRGAHLLALHQRRKMRAILSLRGCSRTGVCCVDTAVQLVWLRFGVRQWSWQLRWRAFGCAERCRSSWQHRSSHGAAVDVFVCLRVLVTCARVVEFGVRRHASGSLQPVWSGSSHLHTLYCQTRPITLLLCSGTSELYAHIRMDRHIRRNVR